MKHLNLNLNKTLSPNSNIVLSSQQAIKSYVDSKKVFVQFLQESAPTTFKTGDKWVNTASNKLFIATNDTTWDNGSNLDTTAIYSFGNLLYHYNGTDTKCYSTTSITEQNTNKEIKEWFGTQDEYNAIETKDENTHYIIIDDTSTSSSLLATQEEFNNSVTDKAATPKQVNEKIGNYLPLAGGNLDRGAILRFTNTNNQVSSVSLDENKYITMSDNLKVSGDINTNSLVSTTGNIYKGNNSGATNIWSDSFATTEKAGIIKVGENLTITEDGILNAEAGGGSGFDFEGTKAEFDAAVTAGTITDDSVSLITDDVSGDTVATKADLAVALKERADKQLTNTNMLTNCILSAPNGVMQISSTDPYTLIVNKGLKVALANGYNADGTPKSEIVTLENDVSLTNPSTTNYNWPIRILLARSYADGSYRVLIPANIDFAVVDTVPENIQTDRYKVFYNRKENLYYEHQADGNLYTYKVAPLGYGYLVGSKFTSIVPYKPIQLSLEGFGDYVIESQVNSDGSWYRKYKSGWLEQGGLTAAVSGSSNQIHFTDIALLLPMAEAEYQLTGNYVYISGQSHALVSIRPTTTTTFSASAERLSGTGTSSGKLRWYVCGQGAN